MAASFWTNHREGITAIATILVAVAAALLVDRAISRRAARLARLFGSEISPVASTRLRLVRRLLIVAIIVLGIGLALSQFAAVKRVATGILASSAILGIVVGFAARQTIANAVAGILLAITQPIRIGDLVTIKDQTGTVEDVRLSYTYLRSGDGRQIIIPNEQLAQGTIENLTIGDPRVRVEASLWFMRSSDALRALKLLSEEPDLEVSIGEIDKEGIRVAARKWTDDAAGRADAEAGLRARCLERLAKEGLSSGNGS